MVKKSIRSAGARLSAAGAAALALTAPPSAAAFLPVVLTPPSASASSRSLGLFGMLPREDGGGMGGGGDDMDVEAARLRLEALIGGGSGDGSSPSSSSKAKTTPKKRRSSPPPHDLSALDEQLDRPPPLTAIARERRSAEISLLRSLETGDDALSDLWALWFSERGPLAAADLLRAEELAGRGPDRWDEAEGRLRDMMDEHGIHWAEPANRLATLLYQMGRLEEARELCELVLAVKPWHFGALSGIVLVCAGLGDAAGARLWSARRLPPFQPVGDNARRREWARRAGAEAERALERAEVMVLESFGELDDRGRSGGKGSAAASFRGPSMDSAVYDLDDLDGAWQ